MTNPFTLSVQISAPYVREDGRLVIKFTVCDTSFEREIESYLDSEGRYILKNIEA